MKLIAILRQINQMFPNPPHHTNEEERVRVKEIVSRFAQGNTYLQQGRYVSKEGIEKRKLSLISYSFMPNKSV